ncbi:MAG: hypothetical protein WCP61_05535 [Chitinophagia bacterium]|jgi:hypothetical protein
MKKWILILICLPFVLISCSKGGGTTTPVTPTPPVVVAEADIAFKLEIDSKEVDYNAIYASLSASQPVNINVTSTPFPKDGVNIEVTVKKDLDNSTVSADTKAGTAAASNPLTVTSLIPGVLCTGTVTVTSKTQDPVSKTYKTLTKTFKIARK